MKKGFVFNVLFLFFLDQVAKTYVRANLPLGVEYPFVEHFISFVRVENTGVSFGMFSGVEGIWSPIVQFLLVALPSFFLFLLGRMAWKRMDGIGKFELAAVSFIIAGGVGNLFDRLVHGAVTDFMLFKFYDFGFFVNNLADDFISVGFVMIVWKGFVTRDSVIFR